MILIKIGKNRVRKAENVYVDRIDDRQWSPRFSYTPQIDAECERAAMSTSRRGKPCGCLCPWEIISLCKCVITIPARFIMHGPRQKPSAPALSHCLARRSASGHYALGKALGLRFIIVMHSRVIKVTYLSLFNNATRYWQSAPSLHRSFGFKGNCRFKGMEMTT